MATGRPDVDRLLARAGKLARGLNEGVEGLEFLVNPGESLGAFPNDEVDLVQSQLVLQHVPGEDAILGCVGEMLRVLRPGGLLFFQVPVGEERRRRFQGRRRLYAALRRMGVPAGVVYGRLGLNPVRMTSVVAERLERRVADGGGQVIHTEPSPVGEGYRSTAYWVGKRPQK